LSGCQGERGDQFDDYLHDYFCHCWRRRDLGIDDKSIEETCDALEKVNECVEARGNVFDGLMCHNVTKVIRIKLEEDTYRK